LRLTTRSSASAEKTGRQLRISL